MFFRRPSLWRAKSRQCIVKGYFAYYWRSLTLAAKVNETSRETTGMSREMLNFPNQVSHHCEIAFGLKLSKVVPYEILQ